MRLLELKLRNFRQHADTDIRFPCGLTGIVGPNGAGKSTLLEAIGWALYGADATRGTNETLLRTGAPPGARVEVELAFRLGGQEYRVSRSLGGAEVREDGSGAPVATGASGATEFLRRRIGMDRREFFSTYFTGQKELQFLASLGPTERARFLATVLGYDRLRVAQGLVRRQRNSLRTRVEGLRAGLPQEDEVRAARAAAEAELHDARRAVAAAEVKVAEARRRNEEIEPRWEAARRHHERHVEVAAELEAATGAAIAAERETERIRHELLRIELAEKEGERLQVELAELPDLVRQHERLDELARTQERRRALSEEVRELGLELERSEPRLSRLEQAPELLQRYRKELEEAIAEHREVEAALEERKTSWLRDRQDAETKLQSYRDRALELQEQLRKVRAAGRDGLCPTCQRPLGADYERLLASLEDQRAEVTQDGKWWRGRHEQLLQKPSEVAELEEAVRRLEERIADRERKRARCEAALQELEVLREERAARQARRDVLRAELEGLPAGYDAGEHKAVAARIEELRGAEQRMAAVEEVIRRRREWEAAALAADERVREARGRVATATEALAEVSRAAGELESLRQAAEEARAELRRVEIALAEARARASAAERAAAAALAAERDLDERLGEVDRVVSELRHHNDLDSAFTRLRTELNDRIRPELSEIASELMSRLTDGRYGTLELDEAYRIVVVEGGSAKPVISGGEEDIANLVLRLALSRMIAERAGHPLSLLVLDEVFGSLDAVRRENVVRLLRRLGNRFEQVLLVTHLEGMRGAMDHVLRVDFDEATGVSTVRWEEGGG
ncbi:MAG TPA: SMC family ATPase [Longimicrobiaceae bacterium]